MKRNPGRGVMLWLLLGTLLCAAPYEWSVTAEKSVLYEHEGVAVTYRCRFADAGALYMIDFNPPRETERYRMELLGERERVDAGRRVNTFRFLLFPKGEGRLTLEFPLLMRKTTRASIENTVIGRDNVEDLDFTDTPMQTPPLTLTVHSNPLLLTGRFTMQMTVGATEVKAFEPVQMSVTVQGEGNPDRLVPFTLDIPGVEVFSEPPEHRFERGEKGLKGSWTQRFALVGDRDFTIPPLRLEYFDSAAAAPRTLVSEARKVRVAPPEAFEPLPEADAAEPWRWEWSYLYYPLTFLAGLVAGLWVRLRPAGETKETDLQVRIASAKTPRQLAVVLTLHDAVRFAPLIEKLDSGGMGLSEGKKAARKALN